MFKDFLKMLSLVVPILICVFITLHISDHFLLTGSVKMGLLVVSCLPGLVLHEVLVNKSFMSWKKPTSVAEWILKIFGIGVIFFGAILWLGNKTGELTSISFAGTAVTLIGLGLFFFPIKEN